MPIAPSNISATPAPEHRDRATHLPQVLRRWHNTCAMSSSRGLKRRRSETERFHRLPEKSWEVHCSGGIRSNCRSILRTHFRRLVCSDDGSQQMISSIPDRHAGRNTAENTAVGEMPPKGEWREGMKRELMSRPEGQGIAAGRCRQRSLPTVAWKGRVIGARNPDHDR